ncbi:MAG: hypothetical protein FWB75_05990 [Oscillospiraceae bacterium]|nr:hypothetical protein [Oscillospiraceae bacterium]
MLFNRKMEPNCSYCQFGTDLGYGELICSKRGVVLVGGSCSSFKYEPTKRVPEPAAVIRKKEYTAEDFTL